MILQDTVAGHQRAIDGNCHTWKNLLEQSQSQNTFQNSMRQECPERGKGNSPIFNNFIFLVGDFRWNSIIYKKNVKNFRKNRRLSPQFLDFGTLLLCVLTDDINIKEMWNYANYPIKFCFFFSEMTRFIAIPKFSKLALHWQDINLYIYISFFISITWSSRLLTILFFLSIQTSSIVIYDHLFCIVIDRCIQ